MLYYDYHNYAGYTFLGAIFQVLFWVLIISLVVMLFRRHRAGQSWKGMMDGAPWKKTPLDILKERYAKGEIQKAEFEDKKKDLV